MIYIEAPTYDQTIAYSEKKKIFLAGGITNVANWQTEASQLFQDTDLIILNPRRLEFSNSPEAAKQQIAWEYYHLKMADAILFWFSNETVQPITLFELGKWYLKKPVFVGLHPEYPRKLDVETQLELDGTSITAYSLPELVDTIKKWYFGIGNRI